MLSKLFSPYDVCLRASTDFTFENDGILKDVRFCPIMNFGHFGARRRHGPSTIVNNRGVKSEALWPGAGRRRQPQKRGSTDSWVFGFRFQVSGFRFQVLGLWSWVLGLSSWGLGFRVQGFGDREGQGSGVRVID